MARDAIVTTLTAFDGTSGAAVADASLPLPQPVSADTGTDDCRDLHGPQQ